MNELTKEDILELDVIINFLAENNQYGDDWLSSILVLEKIKKLSTR